MRSAEYLNLIMKVLKLFFVSLFLTTTVYASYAPEIDTPIDDTIAVTPQNPLQSTKLSENDISMLLLKYAQGESISELVLLKKIIWCESMFNTLAKNESDIEMSYGLVQINIKAHTHISYEQATDPDFAIKFLLEKNRGGKTPRMWVTCYKKATQQ